jgi:exosortase
VALVPLFLWRRWHLIQATSTGTKWPGLALVIVAQLCTVLAASAESYFIEQAAFLLSLLGIGLVVFGTGPIRVFLPLAAILLLTIPLPYTLQAIIAIKLQLISTNLGVAAIELIGVPVFAEGHIIDLGTYKLRVVEACSGLRYLLPLTCISFILGHLYKAPFWKRAVIVVSALPITVLINSFRIALVAVLVDHLDTRMADGFLHQFEGWVVFLIGILLLGFEIIVLERFRCSRINIESIMDRPVTSGDIFPPMKIGGSAVFAA